MTPIRILFEDEYFIAVEKPAGLPSQATVDKSRPDLFTALKNQLHQERGHDFYLALHHRLDRDTSGVMIFAKNKEANTPLAELFQKNQIHKTYLCLTQKRPGPEIWEVENHLAEKRDNKLKKTRMIPVKSGGDRAHTQFRRLKTYSQGLLIEAKPLTGRMHQIRAHLSERGLGIFGDDIYPCAPSPVAPRLMLHAFSLQFLHPWTQNELMIECPLAKDFKNFEKHLD